MYPLSWWYWTSLATFLVLSLFLSTYLSSPPSLFSFYIFLSSKSGSFGQHNSSSGSEATEVKPDVEESTLSELVPSVDDCTSQCSDTEVDHDLNGHSTLRPCRSRPNDTYTVTETADDLELETDGTSRCLSSTAPLGNDAETPLSDEELDKEFDIDFISKDTYDQTCKEDKASSYIEFPCIEPADSISVSSYVSSSRSGVLDAMDEPRNMRQGQPAAANDTTSPSSDPGMLIWMENAMRSQTATAMTLALLDQTLILKGNLRLHLHVVQLLVTWFPPSQRQSWTWPVNPAAGALRISPIPLKKPAPHPQTKNWTMSWTLSRTAVF